MNRNLRLVAGATAVLVGLAACGGTTGGADTSGGADTTAAAESEAAKTVRIGYFPNVTHAPAIIGIEDGLFQEALGDDVAIETATFSTGTEAVEAMFADAIDMSFIGPNPAINGFAQSNGEALRIVSGTTSGGAALVVNSEITSPEDLAGKIIASPSLGNTQDVALRAWLADQGYETDLEGGGDVSVVPQENSQTLDLFQAGEIDGAWVPEPWATRLVLEGGGTVLVDERELWADGEFVTTHLVVATEYLEQNPEVVQGVLEGLVSAVDVANDDPAAAQATVNAGIEAITGSPLAPETIEGAWENLTFTVDPIADSLRESAVDAEAVDLLDPVDLAGIYDLTLLNEVLTVMGRPEITS